MWNLLQIFQIRLLSNLQGIGMTSICVPLLLSGDVSSIVSGMWIEEGGVYKYLEFLGQVVKRKQIYLCCGYYSSKFSPSLGLRPVVLM